MKKTVFILLSCFIAALSMNNLYFDNVTKNSKVSLNDIRVMAVASAEGSSTCETYCPNPGLGCIIKYSNGTMETCPDAHT